MLGGAALQVNAEKAKEWQVRSRNNHRREQCAIRWLTR
jgi:hypothetical protein